MSDLKSLHHLKFLAGSVELVCKHNIDGDFQIWETVVVSCNTDCNQMIGDK